ncbi:YihY/virulence factor BrkB family protein [Ruminococcus sp.]|uniref:YihY/virulence factor BrkB family protein n=1 Tax=Ruminococcus sp. TaxID=41978 RepID=UPI00389100E5
MNQFKCFVQTVFRHVKHFLEKCYRDNISALAGQSSFFLILSAVPFLMFAFSMISILTGRDPASLLPKLTVAEDSQVYPYARVIYRFIEESVRRSGSGTAIVTAVVALWSAGKGMYCLTDGISRIYKLPVKRIWLVRRVYAMGYTVVMLLLMLVFLFMMGGTFIFAGLIMELWKELALRYVLAVLMYIILALIQSFLMTLALKLYLHRKLRNQRRCTFRALFPGMLLTVIAWNLLTFGVMFYVTNFATSSIYGSLGSVFMLMIWIYFMMFILLYGIQINYIYRYRFCRSRKKKRDHDKE